MTRSFGNDRVELELGEGTWTARWPGVGITAGPLAARIHVDGGGVRSDAGPGGWSIETGDGYGRPGAWARWKPRDRGPMLAVHVPADGDIVVVVVGYRAAVAQTLDRIIPLGGLVDLGAPPAEATRLVDGYDSWAYAGVREADRLGVSWWNTAFSRDAGGAGLAVQALDAERFATAIASRLEGGELLVEVSCGATPTVESGEGTWGYETLPPPGLGLPVPPGATEQAPPIALTARSDPLTAVEDLAALAGAVSRARHWDGAPVAGWESWYHYGLVVAPEQLLANARVLRERYAGREGFDLVQLDDGWQVTYGAWWPNDRFPEDLSELTAALRALGARPGLWLAPFMVQPGAPGLGTAHPEWSVRDDDGAPVLDRHGRFGLDASHPEVLAWLRELGAQVRAWGFEMVKLDFLYLAAVEGMRDDARVTGTEALRRGLQAMIDGLGPDVYVLGCGMPLLPAVGICHGNRVGHDLAVPVLLREFGQPLSDGWTGFHGVRPQARNVAARFAVHRRWFDADPDVVMAWGSDGATPHGYSIEESRALATLAALCGGPFLLADELTALSADERAVLEHPGLLDLARGGGFRPADLFEHPDHPEVEQFFAQADLASVWLAQRGSRRVAALFNWTDEPAKRVVPVGFAGAAELWTGSRVDGPSLEVPPHAVRVLVP
jgi:alpha-galactosidase